MDSKNDKDIRCSVCLQEFNEWSVRNSGKKDCPACGTAIPPYLKAFDGYVKVNWQELRILVAYAMRWMGTIDTTKRGNRDMNIALINIIVGLNQFQPPNALPLVAGKENEIAKKDTPVLSPYFSKGSGMSDGDKIN